MTRESGYTFYLKISCRLFISFEVLGVWDHFILEFKGGGAIPLNHFKLRNFISFSLPLAPKGFFSLPPLSARAPLVYERTGDTNRKLIATLKRREKGKGKRKRTWENLRENRKNRGSLRVFLHIRIRRRGF